MLFRKVMLRNHQDAHDRSIATSCLRARIVGAVLLYGYLASR
jgi:hypothetical protein